MVAAQGNAMRGRPTRWIVFVVMLAVATALAFGWARYRRGTVAWQAAVEAPVDLTDRLPEFRGRVADLLARLRNRNAERDIAALGELAQLYQANGYVHEASVAHVALLRFDAE